LNKEQTYTTDQALAKACARCNQRAQRQLYDAYVDVMYNTAYRYCFNREVTEDILQITFTKVFKAIKQYDAQKGSLKAWIRRICVNTAADVLKKEARWEGHWDEQWDVIDHRGAYDELEAEYLLQLIAALPNELRTIFNLYEIEGYSHEEIAQLMEINVNTCRVYLSRAKQKLRKAIELHEKQVEL
jgi:RNA polymerase sigma factor (sigma-70 family)